MGSREPLESVSIPLPSGPLPSPADDIVPPLRNRPTMCKPLVGWDHSGEDSTFWFPGGDMVASTGRMWVAIRQRSKSDYGHGMGIAAACIAAEDAARALVAEMAAALGGSVTWADAQEVSE